MKRKFNPLITGRSAAAGLLAAVVAITVTSCAFESGEPNPVTSKELAIDFDTDLPTRATPTVAADMTKIGVFGYAHPAAGWALSTPANLKPDYFVNMGVYKSGSSAWIYNGPPRYWPDAARKVSFFAYSPYSDVNTAIIATPTAATTAGTPKIAFTVAADVTKQVDLLWDNSQINLNNNITPVSTVAFSMKHALTSVAFMAKLGVKDKGTPNIVTIDDIAVTNVVGAGTIDLSKSPTDPALWTLDSRTVPANLKSYHLTAANGGLKGTPLDARNATGPAFTLDYVNSTNGIMMLIPQSFGDGVSDSYPSELIVKYTVNNTSTGVVTPFTKTFELSSLIVPTMKPGDFIAYKVTISLIQGTVIEVMVGKFAADGSIEWIDEESGNQTIG